MNAESNSGYLLIFRGTDWHKGLSPEQTQKVARRVGMAWFMRLKEEQTKQSRRRKPPRAPPASSFPGRMAASIRSRWPIRVKSKEAIGGFFHVTVASIEEAVAIAKDCPGLNYGAQVEVRPVMEQCPAFQNGRTR